MTVVRLSPRMIRPATVFEAGHLTTANYRPSVTSVSCTAFKHSYDADVADCMIQNKKVCALDVADQS